MASNHEEYSNDIRIFAEKVTKELEVIKLAFSNFLYKTNFQLLFIFCKTLFMHCEFFLRVLPSAV